MTSSGRRLERMESSLEGKVALVTGGSRGIGRATAALLAHRGATVLIGYENDEESASRAVAELEELQASASMRRFDVADPGACKTAVDSIVEEHGGLHLLVNNAGIAMDGLLMRLKDDQWRRSLDVNLSGVMYLCRAVSRPMMKQRAGAIVNVTSVVAQAGNAGQVAYSAAKGGVISLTRSLARELAGRGIRVNAVSPGWIDTDMTARVSDGIRDEVLSKVPLGRAGAPTEVARAIAFLGSDEASYITGHVLDVSGGMYM